MKETTVKIIFKQDELTDEIGTFIQDKIQEALQEQLIENNFKEVSIGKLKITTIDKIKDKETNELSISMFETICAYVDNFVEYITKQQEK